LLDEIYILVLRKVIVRRVVIALGPLLSEAAGITISLLRLDTLDRICLIELQLNIRKVLFIVLHEGEVQIDILIVLN
jgi:hypothetical protein